jgi:uracil-DNA glycosylase
MSDEFITIAASGSKHETYKTLVRKRKECRQCGDVVNPSECADGKFDQHGHIGPWSDWQGNLDAEIMVVGQEWGGTYDYLSKCGRDTFTYLDKTNLNLVDFFNSILQRELPDPTVLQGTKESGHFFFTNAALCLKDGTATGGKPISQNSFNRCGTAFLRPTIELVEPRVVLVLGQSAWRSLMKSYNLPHSGGIHRDDVEGDVVPLSGKTTAVALYHCGGNGLRTRKRAEQEADWKRAWNTLKAT